MQLPGPSDGRQVLVRSIRHRVLATPCREVDQGPEVGRSRELESLGRVGATALAPRSQDGVGVRRAAVEAKKITQI